MKTDSSKTTHTHDNEENEHQHPVRSLCTDYRPLASALEQASANDLEGRDLA